MFKQLRHISFEEPQQAIFFTLPQLLMQHQKLT
jgi:hypothetical protein